MKRRIFNHSMFIALIGLFMALTSVALAQERQSHTLSLTGLAPGQDFVLKLADNQPRNQPLVRVRILVRDDRGQVLTQTEGTVPAASTGYYLKLKLEKASTNVEIQVLNYEANDVEVGRRLQLALELMNESTGKLTSLIPGGATLSGGTVCWVHCTSLLCVHICLHPFASFVVAAPSN